MATPRGALSAGAIIGQNTSRDSSAWAERGLLREGCGKGSVTAGEFAPSTAPAALRCRHPGHWLPRRNWFRGETMGGARSPRHVRTRARGEGAQGPDPAHRPSRPRRGLGAHPRGASAAARAPLGRYAAGPGRAAGSGRGRLRPQPPHSARCGAPWRTRGGRCGGAGVGSSGHRDSAGTAREHGDSVGTAQVGPGMGTPGSADIGPTTSQVQTVWDSPKSAGRWWSPSPQHNAVCPCRTAMASTPATPQLLYRSTRLLRTAFQHLHQQQQRADVFCDVVLWAEGERAALPREGPAPGQLRV